MLVSIHCCSETRKRLSLLLELQLLESSDGLSMLKLMVCSLDDDSQLGVPAGCLVGT
jgi:hypothetical protein